MHVYFHFLQDVINVSKKYLPDMADCLSHPKVNIQVRDGVQYVQEHPQEFDVIITDSSDPIGRWCAIYIYTVLSFEKAPLPFSIVSLQYIDIVLKKSQKNLLDQV